MKYLIGLLLIIHGFITAAQSSGSFSASPSSEIQNPAWVAWWPVSLGRSWLLGWLGLEKAPLTWIAGLLWLVGGIALLAAGLGVMGFIVPTEWWRILAISGAGVSLFVLVIYLHPLMILGTLASIAILVALLWARWPAIALVR
jgi:hypothetical protein